MATVTLVGTWSAGTVPAAANGTDAIAVKAATAAIGKTDTDAAIGVLVADGALPTQAHVTTAAAAWATLEGQIDTALAAAAVGSGSGDVLVTVNLANVATMNKLRKVLEAIVRAAEGSGAFSP
jgi:hypothetical protein